MSAETKLRQRVAIKAVSVDVETRTFEGLASTWDRDLQGDVILPGAFKKTIREWKKSGKVLPLLDSHSWFSIFDTVGKLVDAEERDEGLWTQWKIIPGAKGDEVLTLLSEDNGGPFIDSMSIGYRATRWEMQEDPEQGDEVRVIKEIMLDEVSLVRFPANPNARIDAGSVQKTIGVPLSELIEQAPADMRPEIKSVLQEALGKCEGPACAKKGGAPAEPPAAPPAAKPDVKDEGEPPDFEKYDQLRLRQLASRTTILGGHHG